MAEITINAAGLTEALQAFEGLSRVPNFDLHRIMAQTAFSSTMLRFRFERGPGGVTWDKSQRAANEGGKTLKDTSLLVQSIVPKWNEQAGRVGTNKEYAAIHQFGGTIRPKRAGALAIPLTPEAKAEGWPSDFKLCALRLVWPKGSLFGWLEEKFSTDPKPKVHYKLVHKVTLPARPFLGIDAEDIKAILNAITVYLGKKTNGVLRAG